MGVGLGLEQLVHAREQQRALPPPVLEQRELEAQVLLTRGQRVARRAGRLRGGRGVGGCGARHERCLGFGLGFGLELGLGFGFGLG